MVFEKAIRKSRLRRLAVALLLISLLFQASCWYSTETIDRAGDNAKNQIIAGIVVAVVVIAIVIASVSDTEAQEPPTPDCRVCTIENQVALRLEMFVDGHSVGIIDPGGSLDIALEPGWYDLRWYPVSSQNRDQYVQKYLEVSGDPVRYELKLQQNPGSR